MAITVGMSEQNRAPLLDIDSYAARCYMLVELGTHTAEYKNQKGGVDVRKVRKVRIGFEIPGKTADFGKGHQEPYVVSRDYTASFGGPSKPSNLLKDVQAWRGKPFSADELKSFDLNKLVGVPAFVSITHQLAKNGNMYANIGSIIKLPSAIPAPPPPVLKPLVYSIEQGAGGCFNDLPEFVRERIMQSEEWQAAIKANVPTTEATRPADNQDDDVAF